MIGRLYILIHKKTIPELRIGVFDPSLKTDGKTPEFRDLLNKKMSECHNHIIKFK